MAFLENAWYVAAWASEIGGVPLSRKIAGHPVVIYRAEDSLVALQDRCPHRFVPLSQGNVIGQTLQCRYHGLRFDGTGACVLNPHGDGKIPGMASVRSYPVVERHGIVWLWPGDPRAADPGAIPGELAFLDGPQSGFRAVRNYIHGQYRYDILVDNLMDLSHQDFLHVGSFSAGHVDDVETDIVQTGSQIRIERRQRDTEMPPAMAPLYDPEGSTVEYWQDFNWAPPGISWYEFGVVKSGRPRAEGAAVRVAHFATPETETTTHYFAAIARPASLDDGSMDDLWRQIQLGPLLNEDSPMLEKQEQAMGQADFWDMRPVFLQTDAAPLRVRREMERLLKLEQVASA